MVRQSGLALLSFLSLLVVIPMASVPALSSDYQVLLREKWLIQPSADVHSDGPTISRTGFSTQGWYPATLPSTVLSALVQDKVPIRRSRPQARAPQLWVQAE